MKDFFKTLLLIIGIFCTILVIFSALMFGFRGGDKVEGTVKMYSNGKVVQEYEYYDRQRISDQLWKIWLKDGKTVDIQGDLVFEEVD